MVPGGGKHIKNFAVIGCGIAYAIGCQQRQAETVRDAYGRLVAPFLFTVFMALQLYEDILRAEQPYQFFGNRDGGRFSAVHQGGGHGPFIAARQADQPGSILCQIVEGRRTLAFGRLPHLEAGDQLAQILIAGARSAEQRQTRSFGCVAAGQPIGRHQPVAQVGNSYFCAHMRAYPVLFSQGMKARRPVQLHCGRAVPWRACSTRLLAGSGLRAEKRLRES